MQLNRVGSLPCGLHLGIGPCKNACVYCFAEGQSATETLGALANQISKPYNGTLLSKWIERRVPVMVNNRSDVFNNVEPDMTIAKVDLLRDSGFPIYFETKGPHTPEQMKWFFDGMKKHEAVYLTVTTLDDEKRKIIEPHAPSIEQRFAFIRECVRRGVYIEVGINPSIRGYASVELLDALYDAGVRDFILYDIHMKTWGYRKEWAVALKPFPAEEFRPWFDSHPDCTFLCSALWRNKYPQSLGKLRAALGPASECVPTSIDAEMVLLREFETMPAASDGPRSIFRGMTPGEIVELLPMRSSMDFMVKRSDITPKGFAKNLNMATFPAVMPYYKLIELELDMPDGISGLGSYMQAGLNTTKALGAECLGCRTLWWPPFNDRLEAAGWEWTPLRHE